MTGDLWDRLLAIFFPNRCVLCGEVVESQQLACGQCAMERPDGRILYNPHIGQRNFLDAIAPFLYADNVRKAIIAGKTRMDKRTFAFFANEMADLLNQKYGDIHFDRIVEVPQSKARLRQGRFNQAGSLAKGVHERSGIAWEAGVLSRSDDSLSQHTLKLKERMDNAAKSYGVIQGEKVAGAVILLVDDVLTSGSTANACAGCLLEAGAKAVYVLTATARG